MVAKDRRVGSRNWIPGLFAAFWILLAAFSGAYLFRIVTDPAQHRTEMAMASPAAPSTQESPSASIPTQAAAVAPLSAEEVKALQDADAAKDREIGELKESLHDLSGQVADLNARFKPLEKVLGPVAALPTSTSVTTSMPSPEPMRPDIPPEPIKPSPAKEPAKPAEAVKPVEAAKPAEKPAEQAKASEKAEPAKPIEKPPAPVKPAERPPVQAKATPEPVVSEEAPDEASSPSGAAPDERSISADEPSPHSATGAKGEKPSEAHEPVEVTANEAASSPPAASTDSPDTSAPPPIPPGTTRFGIEIGSVEKQDKIRPMWRDLLTNHAALVAGLQARRIIAPDKKWRLIAGPFSSAAEASQACALFKKASMPCEATVFAGDAL
jgi:hypothetical protein